MDYYIHVRNAQTILSKLECRPHMNAYLYCRLECKVADR